MASLDGNAVNVTDSVFDVVYGPGTVVQLFPNGKFLVVYSATPTFETVKQAMYDSNGVSSRMRTRTLYWKNPIVVIPTKNDATWTKLQEMMACIRANLI